MPGKEGELVSGALPAVMPTTQAEPGTGLSVTTGVRQKVGKHSITFFAILLCQAQFSIGVGE